MFALGVSIVVFLLLALIWVFSDKYYKAVAAEIEQAAEELGFSYSRQGNFLLLSDTATSLIYVNPEDKRDRPPGTMDGYMEAERDGVVEAVFNANGQTIAYFRSTLLNLPCFCLIPKGRYAVVPWTLREVIFDDEDEAEFASRYRLFGIDLEMTERQMSQERMAFFLSHPGAEVLCELNTVIYFFRRTLVSAEDIPAFLNEAREVVELFTQRNPG